ncbi:MAG: metalloregulator ArsR/SmtB family transcription factor [Bacillaceae bacterium]|nr:metalloregulator ArsR/SmtB family transcription factor [Bacillaceae bacterium]
MSPHFEETIESTAVVLKLLGDKTRLKMIALIKQRECCVCEFVEMFQMSQPSISQHVRKLKDAQLIKETRKGQWIFYSMNESHPMISVVDSILTHIPDQKEHVRQLEKIGKAVRCDEKKGGNV